MLEVPGGRMWYRRVPSPLRGGAGAVHVRLPPVLGAHRPGL